MALHVITYELNELALHSLESSSYLASELAKESSERHLFVSGSLYWALEFLLSTTFFDRCHEISPLYANNKAITVLLDHSCATLPSMDLYPLASFDHSTELGQALCVPVCASVGASLRSFLFFCENDNIATSSKVLFVHCVWYTFSMECNILAIGIFRKLTEKSVKKNHKKIDFLSKLAKIYKL